MDNNYFENLANAIQDEEPASTQTSQGGSEATLTVKVDVDCKLYCDGDFMDLFEANKVKKISVPTGQHLFTVESERFNEVSEDIVLEIDQPGKNYLLLVKDLKERENAEVLKKENAKDNERKATKAEEAKRKSEEEQERKKEKSAQEAEECMKKGMEYYNARIYDIALSCFEKVLETSDDPEALLFIGKCYEGQDGDDESIRDYEKAITWYRKAAEKGNARAQNIMGNRYFNGKGVEQNYVEAVKWYRKSAMQGWAFAQFNLGNCYFNGQGVAKDTGEAISWFTKAAEQGIVLAQSKLGQYYYHCYYESAPKIGILQPTSGNEEEYEKAIKWLTMAAEQGDVEAQYILGKCYSSGSEKVASDDEKSFEWFKKASEQGCEDAIIRLASSPAGVDVNERIKWLKKLSNQGSGPALYSLGLLYEGLNFELDTSIHVDIEGSFLEESFMWFSKAAENGYAEAQYKLGLFYLDGYGVEKDPAKAMDWFLEAAEQGHMKAQNSLKTCYSRCCGSMFYEGAYKITNKEAVAKWLNQLSEQGDAKAQAWLGICYESGLFVEKDLNQSAKWRLKAAEQGHKFSQQIFENTPSFHGFEEWKSAAIKCLKEAAKEGSAWAKSVLEKYY